jgi:hypothetical protein
LPGPARRRADRLPRRSRGRGWPRRSARTRFAALLRQGRRRMVSHLRSTRQRLTAHVDRGLVCGHSCFSLSASVHYVRLSAALRRRRAGGGQVVPAHLHSRRAACLERQAGAGVGVAVPVPAGRLVLHGGGLSGPTGGEALLDLPVLRSEGDASRPGRPRRNCRYSACCRSGSTFAATLRALGGPTSEAGNCRRVARHARARP